MAAGWDRERMWEASRASGGDAESIKAQEPGGTDASSWAAGTGETALLRDRAVRQVISTDWNGGGCRGTAWGARLANIRARNGRRGRVDLDDDSVDGVLSAGATC